MELDSVAEISDQKSKLESYRAAMQQSVASEDVQACNAFVDHRASLSLLARRKRLRCLRSICRPGIPVATLSEVCAAVLQEDVPLVVSRQLLSMFTQEITQLAVDKRKEVAI